MHADALWYDDLIRRESFESNETTCCNLGLFETYFRWLLGGTRRIRYWIIYFYLYMHLIFWIALFLDCTKRRMFVCVWKKSFLVYVKTYGCSPLYTIGLQINLHFLVLYFFLLSRQSRWPGTTMPTRSYASDGEWRKLKKVLPAIYW